MSWNKTWDMQTQLKQGKKAEEEMAERHPSGLTVVTEHRLWDLESSCGRKKVELKTDTYDMSKTENFFMERWSVAEKEKPGGPWQALENGANIFIYLFSKNNTYFECRDLKKLVKRLNTLTKDIKPTNIRNIKWTTQGFKVRRADLEDCFEEWEWK
jgi:hypothetical protein